MSLTMITIHAASSNRLQITCTTPDECIVVRLFLQSGGFLLEEYWIEGTPASGLKLASKMQRITGWPVRFFDFTKEAVKEEQRKL